LAKVSPPAPPPPPAYCPLTPVVVALAQVENAEVAGPGAP
jgi:hypothetical protein